MNNKTVIARSETTKQSRDCRVIAALFLAMTLSLCAALLLPNAAHAQDFTTGLVGHWKLDETGGSTITDSAGTSDGAWVDGANNDATEETNAGKIGRSLRFDGVDDRIEDTLSIDLTGNSWSVSAWFNSGSSRTGRHTIIGSQSGTYGSEHRIYYEISCDCLRVKLGDQGSGGLAWDVATGLFDNQWHHIVVTGVHADQLQIYLDGSLTNTEDISGSQTNGTININPPFAIGSFIGNSVYQDFFDGLLDDVRFYDRALTAEDVAALYDARAPGVIRYNTENRVIEFFDDIQWVPTAPPKPTTAGLVGWWKMDEASGGVTPDSSGNGNDATLGNSPELVSGGIVGEGTIELTDAEDDYLDAGSPDILDDLGAMTGSIWVKLNDRRYATVFLSKGYGAAGWLFQTNLFNDSGSVVFEANYLDGSPNELKVETDNGLLGENEWHHLAFTWDGTPNSSGVHIYINGVEATYKTPTEGSGTYRSDANYDLEIGKHHQASDARIDGLIDDARLYNRALSAAEIADLYKQGVPDLDVNLTSGLVGHWRLDETSGALADASGNGYSGTASGGPEYASYGRIGYGMGFDGVDDYTSGSLQALSAPVTLCAWGKIAPSSTLLNPSTGGTHTFAALRQNSFPDEVFYIGMKKTSSTVLNGVAGALDNNNGGFSAAIGSTDFYDSSLSDEANSQWHHVCGRFNSSSSRDVFINGVWEATDTGVEDTQVDEHMIGASNNSSQVMQFFMHGLVDDVRVYNRALTDTEIRMLATGACENPLRATGTIIYNTTSDQMQFCNGEDWIAMGPPGDGGGGCTNPAGAEGELRYNSAYNYMQYCEGSDWIKVGLRGAPEIGLVGHWKLDETSGGTITDYGSGGNDGIWYDSANDLVSEETITGRYGNALTFDGANYYIEIGDPADGSLDFGTGDFTVAAWARSDAPTPQNMEILGKAGSGQTSFWLGFNTGLSGCGQHTSYGLGFRVRDSSQSIRDNFVISNDPGVWHHLVGVRDGLEISLYVDGALVESCTNSQINNASSAGTLKIGDTEQNSSSWDGAIDDVRIYNRALSAGEIYDLYNKTGGN